MISAEVLCNEHYMAWVIIAVQHLENPVLVNVWRLTEEKYDINCFVPTVKHGGGGVMIQRYIEEILGCHMIPFLESFEEENGDYLFQQDNAPIHTSARTRNFIEESEINLLPWPGQSPDLNPIEYLWDELERRIRANEQSKIILKI
ncbi:transposable element Tcb1 transposase [Rhizophagus irregularis DAOM 181602=DAOM 197198]|nr:transposable element Tcb1 transposase [Rhizophagus irregularis DAOM 181602=DAOM 197198]